MKKVLIVSLVLVILFLSLPANGQAVPLDAASCRLRCWEKWSACVSQCNGKTDDECGVPCMGNKLSCERDCEAR